MRTRIHPKVIPHVLPLNLKIQGDEMVFDYRRQRIRSSPRRFNIPTGGDERHELMMVGAVYVLYTLDPTILRNTGLLRSSRCILPKGSIMNPEFPAAVGMRSLAVGRLMATIFGAFAQALPHKLQAGPRSRRTFAQRAHHRQQDRPERDGKHQPHHLGRGSQRRRKWLGRLRSKPGFFQKTPRWR